MPLVSTTLRPGLLVGLKTSIKGNVKYYKTPTEEETIDGVSKARWNTERTIADAAEHERASDVRSKARSTVSRVCAATAFGLLCPESDAEKLAKAIVEARAIVEEFNVTAKVTRVFFGVVSGRIAPDDEQAVKEINKEVRELIAAMELGVKNLDVQKIRDAATAAREIGQMLTPDAQARITIAIEAARATAKAIVKAGETAAQEIDTATIKKLTEVRTAFLDLDGPGTVAAPTVTGRGLDLSPAETAATLASLSESAAAQSAPGRSVDLEFDYAERERIDAL